MRGTLLALTWGTAVELEMLELGSWLCKIDGCSPALALSHGGGLDRTGDSVGAVGHGDVAGLF